MKGASTAIVGAVPVANGSGGTTFQRIGVSSLSGSLPTNVPDLALVTDGNGGFKDQVAIYGSFRQSRRGSSYTTYDIDPVLTSSGIVITKNTGTTSDALQVSRSGLYLVGQYSTITTQPPSSGQPEGTSPGHFASVSGVITTPLLTDATGLLRLTTGVNYRLVGHGNFYIWRLTA